MQKYIYIVVLFIVFMGFTHSATGNSLKTYNIGFLLDNKNEETEVLMSALQNQIKAVVGEDALIVFPAESILINDYNLQKARQNYNQLLSDKTDIIIAFGVVSNEVISKQNEHKKPTVLFGAVNQDFIDLDISKKTSGIKNFTYLIESESYKKDLMKLKQLTDFSKVAVLVDEQISHFIPLDTVLTQALQGLSVSYKIIPFKTVDDISAHLSDIDAVYLAGGFFLNSSEVTQLSQILIDKKLPSFTLNAVDQVVNGIMASHQSEGNIDQFFRRIALTIESYISGTPLSQMPVYIDYTSKLTMNYNTADAVGVPIKYSLISDTDFVGEMKNSRSKQSYNLLMVIDQVLSKNRNLASSQLAIALKKQNVKLAKSNYLPSVSTSFSGTHIDPDLAAISNGSNPEFSTTGRIDLAQTVFSDAANANIEIQKHLQNAQQENYNAEELNIIFDAINAYFTTLILKSNIQIQLQNLKLTKENLNLATQSYEVGQAGKSDLLRFKSQKAQNTQTLVEAANQLEQSFIMLNQLMNNPVGYQIDIADVEMGQGVFKKYSFNFLTELLDDPTLTEPFVEYLVQQAKINSPEIKELDSNILATERDIKLNGARRYLPTISLQGQYNKTFSRNGAGDMGPAGAPLLNNNHNLVLNFSVSLFNRNQFNINRQTAIIQKEQLDINKQNVNLTIEVNIRNGVLNLINQMSNIKLSEVSEAAAKEALDLTKTAYTNGAVNIVQLIDAQSNFIQSQLTKTNALYNFLITSLQLERFIGHYFLLNTEEKNNQFKNAFFDYLTIYKNKQEIPERNQ